MFCVVPTIYKSTFINHLIAFLVEAGEEKDAQVRSGDRHSRNICKRRESAGVMFAERQVIGVGGKASLSNAPAAVGGSKSLLYFPCILNHLKDPTICYGTVTAMASYSNQPQQCTDDQSVKYDTARRPS